MSAGRDDENTRDDHDVALYRQMQHLGSPTLAAAADALSLTEEEVTLARERLHKLGLITHREADPCALIHVGAEVAIVQALAKARNEIDQYRERIIDTHQTLERITDRFLSLGPGSGARREVDFELMTDLRRVAAYLDSATDLAREEVLTMHPGPAPAPHLLREGRERNRRHAERGLRLRTIYQRRVASLPHMTAHLRDLAQWGYEIRTAQVVPVRMLIFDRRRAVLPLDHSDGRAGAIAVEGESLVQSLVAFHDYCWQHSTSVLQTPADPADDQLTARELAVLRMLAAGLKDEKIARNLGVSLRTVTRTVSELMVRLGVENRFQVGIRASRLGWVE